MSDYYEKSMRALQLAGLSEKTQEAYTRAVTQLVKFYGKQPDKILEEEVEDYFLHCTNNLKWAKATLRVSHYGIRFYFQKVLKRDYHLFSYLKAGTERKLPCILSREEVTRILHHVTTHHNYAFFHLVYSCGLRLSEGVNIQISDIDKTRMMIHVHRGKGAKDRYVPLPEETLLVLRKFWVTHRNPTFIFPARGRGNNEASTTDQPMPVSTPQEVFRKARYAAGIKKRRVTVHTLRHCYATHLLEAGVNPRAVQVYMGHKSLETTMAYFHLTHKGSEKANQIINQVMKGVGYEQNH